MATLWYFLIASMLGLYVALDGMDMGVGLLHLWVARDERERAQTLRSIGPVWDGNEVWLVAAGGVLFAMFPALYAKLFSGFYLALMGVLWVLLFRALAIELRHHLSDPLWVQFWDVAFCWSSLLAIAVFGFAMGNLVRGVALDETGEFFAPLWTNFRIGEEVGILDWYTLFIAVSALVAVAFHGGLWLAHKTDGEVQRRASRLVRSLSTVLFAAALPVTVLTGLVQPQLLQNLVAYPVPFLLLSLVAFGGMLGAWYWVRVVRYDYAFRSSGVFLVAMVLSAAFGLYPQAIAARNPAHSILIQSVAAPDSVLRTAVYWFVPGIALAIGYTWIAYRRLPRVFSVNDSDH